MNNKKIKKLLYKSLDTTLTTEEAKILNNELQNSIELREEQTQLLNMRKALGESTETSFKIFFEERLSDKLSKLTTLETYFNGWANSVGSSFRKIALSAIIVLIILISYNLNSGNKYSIENLLGTSNTTIVSAFEPIQNLIASEKQ